MSDVWSLIRHTSCRGQMSAYCGAIASGHILCRAATFVNHSRTVCPVLLDGHSPPIRNAADARRCAELQEQTSRKVLLCDRQYITRNRVLPEPFSAARAS